MERPNTPIHHLPSNQWHNTKRTKRWDWEVTTMTTMMFTRPNFPISQRVYHNSPIPSEQIMRLPRSEWVQSTQPTRGGLLISGRRTWVACSIIYLSVGLRYNSDENPNFSMAFRSQMPWAISHGGKILRLLPMGPRSLIWKRVSTISLPNLLPLTFIFVAKLADSTPTINIREVIPKIEEELGGKLSGPEPKLEYVLKGADQAVLTYKFQIHNVKRSVYLGVNVDAHTGEIVRVVDYSSKASVSVLVD